jgi:hypothetical protein
MMAQLGMIILHVLFWCTVFACAFLNDKPVPHVVSQTVSALFTPIFDHVLPHLKQMQEYSVEALKASQQRRFTFEREQQEREILLQAHRHCVSFCNEPSAIDPELRFVCRTLLLKLFPNITKKSSFSYS